MNKATSYSYLPNKRDASDVIVAMYTNGANINKVHKPFSEIIRILRKRNIEQNILKLSKRIKIVDQRETTVASKSTYPGDKGLFTFPTAMQGKWYYWNEYEKKIADLVVTEHQIGSSKGLSEVHIMDPKFLATYDYSKISSDYKKALRIGLEQPLMTNLSMELSGLIFGDISKLLAMVLILAYIMRKGVRFW